MTIELQQANRPPVEVAIDSPKSSGRFRRSTATLCLLANCAVAAALMWRTDDLGPNVTEIVVWIVIVNGLSVLGAIGFKAWETLGLIRGRRP